MLRAVSRRTALRGIGVSGGAVAAWFLATGIIQGDSGRALASSLAKGKAGPGVQPQCISGPCPPPATGVCDCAASACITGGRKCSCICSGECDCDPEFVAAECSWQLVCENCFFSCRCIAC